MAIFNPGGTDSPGGGPLAVENPPGLMLVKLFMLIGPVAVSGVGGLVLPGWPARTPKGFLEKLSRMPPLTLL